MSEQKSVLAALAVWLLAVLLGAAFGIFRLQILHAPIPLGMAALLPVLLFLGWYWTSPRFQQLVLSLSLRKLTLVHAWRMSGVIFVILYFLRVLPGGFALPAGLGDMAIGITSPLVASMLKADRPFPTRIFVLWNVLGILDMVLAVGLGVLYSLPLGFLTGGITTQYMARFPLNLVPTFLVPFFLILHLIAIIGVRRLNAKCSAPC